MITRLKKHRQIIAIATLLLVNLFLLINFLNIKLPPLNNTGVNQISLEKTLEDFKQKNLKGFKEISEYFSNLAKNKGAVYAYELLKVAPIPPETDMHLLGHTVGDVLYKQEGARGMYKCTPDFRNACSHTIVVGLLFENGEGGLSEIADICRKAPGGSGAYTMCFHGLGHGVLAYNDYNLEKAVAMCKKTGSAQYSGREVGECVGGAIMEIISGGFHDKVAWEKERKNYLSDTEPLRPCSLDIIPREAKQNCYSYLTPHLFQVAGANLSRPDPKIFSKATSYCDKIPASDVVARRPCYSGFGKEYIVLVKDRDIRNMNKFTKEELLTVHKWCNLSKGKNGVEFCTEGAVSSLFWGGENDPQVSVNFCSSTDETLQKGCFDVLLGNAFQYLKNKDTLNNFCNILPEIYKQTCLIG